MSIDRVLISGLLVVAVSAGLECWLARDRLILHAVAPSAVFAARGLAIVAALIAVTRLRFAGLAAARLRPEHWIAGGLLPVAAGLAAAAVADHLGWVDAHRVALRSVFVSGCLAGASGWSVALSLEACAAPGRIVRVRRRAVALALGIFVAAVGAEFGLALWSNASDSALLYTEGAAPTTIERFRPAPGTIRLGVPFNSAGYDDDEFLVGAPDRVVVALVADSFGVGVVPREYGLARVAERALGDSAAPGAPGFVVHNFGVAAIGVPEYEWLLASDVPAYRPAAAVVLLYPGNDLPSAAPLGRRAYNPREWRLATLIDRLARVLGERLRGSPIASPREGLDAAALDVWVPSEMPSMSRGAYMGVVARQQRALDPDGHETPARIDALVGAVERMRERADFEILVVLAPTELQVSAALRAEVAADRPDVAAIDADAVHATIAARLRASGFETLDLLPVLRAAEEGGRTYQPRDSHWNVRGNAVAGDAIAAFLQRSLLRETATTTATMP